MNVEKATVTEVVEKIRSPYQPPTLTEYGAIHHHTQGASGTVGDGSGVMAMPQSDERLKTNIKKVGEHEAGFGLYFFDFKPEFQRFGAGRQFGVMAQEVEQVMPNAVRIGEDGYRQVNYALLGISRSVH